MRKRYADTELAGFHPHEVLELLLFDVIRRSNTNDLAHAMLAKREDSLAEVLLDPPAVYGIGEKTRLFLLEAGERMERMFLESLAVSVEKSQFYMAAIWYLRRFPDRVLLMVVDANDRLVSRELPGETEFADTLKHCISQLRPGQLCHIAMGSSLENHPKLPTRNQLGMVLLLDEHWQPQWL